MSAKLVMGIVLLLAGTVLIILGAAAPQVLADGTVRGFSSWFSQPSTSYLIGGIGAVGFGLLVVLFQVRKLSGVRKHQSGRGSYTRT